MTQEPKPFLRNFLWDSQAMRRAFLHVGLAILLAWAASGDDIFSRNWTQGSKAKQKTWAECEARLARLKEGELGPPEQQWVLEHRLPAVYVIKRDLTAGAEGGYRMRLLRWTRRLAAKEVGPVLPQLLAEANTHGERLAIAGTMAGLRDLTSRRTLRLILRLAVGGETRAHALAEIRDGGDEQLFKLAGAMARMIRGMNAQRLEQFVLVAAEGVARCPDADRLKLLHLVERRLIHSEFGKLRIAGLLCRCGEGHMAWRVLAPLLNDDASAELKAYAVDFLYDDYLPHTVRHMARLRLADPQDARVRELETFVDKAMEALGKVAADCPDEAMAGRALALLCVVARYGLPLEDEPVLDEEDGVKDEEVTGPERNVPEQLMEKDRRKLVAKILSSWSTQKDYLLILRGAPPRE